MSWTGGSAAGCVREPRRAPATPRSSCPVVLDGDAMSRGRFSIPKLKHPYLQGGEEDN